MVQGTGTSSVSGLERIKVTKNQGYNNQYIRAMYLYLCDTHVNTWMDEWLGRYSIEVLSVTVSGKISGNGTYISDRDKQTERLARARAGTSINQSGERERLVGKCFNY